MLGRYVHLIGTFLIVVLTAVAGYLCLQAMYPEVNPVVPVIIYIFIGYIVAKLFMNVLGIAVDTTLQCFIAIEEIHIREEDFVPKLLRTFMRDRDLPNRDSPAAPCCGALPC